MIKRTIGVKFVAEQMALPTHDIGGFLGAASGITFESSRAMAV